MYILPSSCGEVASKSEELKQVNLFDAALICVKRLSQPSTVSSKMEGFTHCAVQIISSHFLVSVLIMVMGISIV